MLHDILWKRTLLLPDLSRFPVLWAKEYVYVPSMSISGMIYHKDSLRPAFCKSINSAFNCNIRVFGSQSGIHVASQTQTDRQTRQMFEWVKWIWEGVLVWSGKFGVSLLVFTVGILWRGEFNMCAWQWVVSQARCLSIYVIALVAGEKRESRRGINFYVPPDLMKPHLHTCL